MAMRGTKTIKFGEFMSGEYNRKAEERKAKKRAIIKAATTGSLIVTASKVAIPAMMVTIPIALLTKSFPAMAATSATAAVPVGGVISDAVKSRIMHSFDPLVDLMVSLSIPIAGVMITGGCLLVLIGLKEKGYTLITSASLGYILVQLSPMFIDLLIGIGKAV